MAIRSVASSNGFLPFTASAPAGTVAGDRLLAFITTDAAAGNLIAPSGWTSLMGQTSSSGGQCVFGAHEVKSSTGGESFTWDSANSTGSCVVTIFAVTGATLGDAYYELGDTGLQDSSPSSRTLYVDFETAEKTDLFATFIGTPYVATDVISFTQATSTNTPSITFTSKYDKSQPGGATKNRTMSTSYAPSVAAMIIVQQSTTSVGTNVPATNVNGFVEMFVGIPLGSFATLTTLGGPASGATGVASSNFTVGVDLPVTGTVTITPNSGGGGGTFTPTSLAFSGGTVSGTFTYTAPAGSGDATRTIGITNDGGLPNPPTVDYFARDAAYAVADIVVTGWDPTAPVVTPLASVIDEAAADDGDYIQSPVINGSQGPAVFQLNKPLAAGSLTVPIRARFIGTAGQVRVLLTDDANTIWGTSAWQVLTGAFSLYSLSVTTSGTSTRIRLEVQ